MYWGKFEVFTLIYAALICSIDLDILKVMNLLFDFSMLFAGVSLQNALAAAISTGILFRIGVPAPTVMELVSQRAPLNLC